MITIPPRHYCVIENPVMRDPKEGKVIVDEYGQIRLRHADQVIVDSVIAVVSLICQPRCKSEMF